MKKYSRHSAENGRALKEPPKRKDLSKYKAGDSITLPSYKFRCENVRARSAVIEKVYTYFLLCKTTGGYMECLNLHSVE